MNISRLVIRDYRNFSLLDVPVQKGVTCVLGENNAGKSNLFHALRLAMDVNLPSSQRQLTENDVHGCGGLSSAQQILIAVEFTGFADSPEQCAMCGLWEVASGSDVNSAIKQGSRGSTSDRSRHRLRQSLIVLELAMALTLLAGAGYFVRGIQVIAGRELGWNPEGIVVGYIGFPPKAKNSRR